MVPSFAQDTVEEGKMTWKEQKTDTVYWSLCPSANPVHCISFLSFFQSLQHPVFPGSLPSKY